MAEYIYPIEQRYLLSIEAAVRSFAEQPATIYAPKQIHQFITDHQHQWLINAEIVPEGEVESQGLVLLPANTHNAILTVLIEKTELQRIRFPFPYRTETRYTWGEASITRIIQSVDPVGYFSHYSAVEFHGLTEQIPKVAYFNVEQPATGGGGTLSQEGIDRAFKGKCRVSNNVVKFRNITIHKLNGQNTQNLGVISAIMGETDQIRVTNIERTLIDVAVRPVYAGGVSQVAQAYQAASHKLSIPRIVEYLRALNYTYPYHQAIGFYLDKTQAFTEDQLSELRQFPIAYNFYLNYQLKNPGYNERWQLFVPKGF